MKRASVHAALGDPARLAMVDELAVSDRSPAELATRFEMPSNLLAHHLSVLEQAGLIERFPSSGDRRRRYVRLNSTPLLELGIPVMVPDGLVLFVCTHNSARSQLAAALWNTRTGRVASSAGTHPTRIHPKAIAAAERAGLDLRDAEPQHIDDAPDAALTITVCDRAHEELAPDPGWWHWSTPAPTEVGTAAAFDATIAHLDARIRALN